MRRDFWLWLSAVALGVYLALWLAQGDIAANGRPYHYARERGQR